MAQFQSGSWNGLEPLDAGRSLANEVGEVDVLVNNGGFSWFGATDQLDTDTYDRLFASNVRSAYQLVAVLAPRMAKAGRGSIHLDLITTDFDAERAGLIGLGTRKVRDVDAGDARWTTFADVEGNEFDLIAG